MRRNKKYIRRQLLTIFEANKDEVLKNMTLDMTFEAREKIIRRDEFEAGQIAGYEAGQAAGEIAGYAAGQAAGQIAGQAEKSEAIFLNMISNGYDIAEAVKMTGISKERAEEIVKTTNIV